MRFTWQHRGDEDVCSASFTWQHGGDGGVCVLPGNMAGMRVCAFYLATWRGRGRM